jgi:tetratricopeptide (TPR) repeat protein
MKNPIALSIFYRTCDRLILAFLAMSVFAVNVFAADVTGDFSAANRFYAEGKFSAAAIAYESILNSGAISPNLLFNFGNAEFKAGNLGKAIAAFRRAELLAPRDPEIRANLDFVRNQVQGSTFREHRWQDWLGQLTLNEWSLLAVIALWGTLILFTLRQLRPALVPKLRASTSFLVVITILLGAALGVQATDHFSNSVAVVTTAGAIARSGPFGDAQVAFVSHDGAELAVMNKHDEWFQVADGTGKIGWLSKTQVQVLPGA